MDQPKQTADFISYAVAVLLVFTIGMLVGGCGVGVLINSHSLSQRILTLEKKLNE